jgi:hypothetical protein
LIPKPVYATQWKTLNPDPFFETPTKDPGFYSPLCVTEYMYNGSRIVEPVSEHEFANGTWNIVFEQGKAVMNFDHNGTDFAHIRIGSFWRTLGWLSPEKLSRDYEVEVQMKFRIVNFTDGEWLRAGVAFAMQVDFTVEDPYKPPYSKFVELDFFRGNKTIPGPNPSVFLVDFYHADVGVFYSLRFPLTRYVPDFVEEDYLGWAVYVAIESIQSQMAIEVYEFSVYYRAKTDYYVKELTHVVIGAFAVAFGIIIVKKLAKKLTRS